MDNFFIEIFEEESISEDILDHNFQKYEEKGIKLFFSKKKITFYRNKKDSDILVLCSLTKRDRSKIFDKFSLKEKYSDAELLLKIYLKHGIKAFDYLGNSFSFFIYNFRIKRFFIIRDHIGFNNIYYTKINNSIFLTSTLGGLKRYTKNNFTIDKKNLKNFLHMIPIKSNETFYSEIKKVPPSHFLELSNGFLSMSYYNKFNDIEIPFSKEIQINGLTDLLKKAIIRDEEILDEKIGFLFSGGLDSSTVISFYEKYKKSNQKLFSYTATFDHIDKEVKRFIEEKSFQEEITRNKNIKDRSFKAENLSTLSNLDKFIKLIGQPFFFPNLYVPAESFRIASQDGVKKVFNGNDGDSVISHGYEHFLEMFLKFRWIILYKSIKKVAHTNNKSIIFIFKRAVLDQILFYNKIFFSAKKKHKAILSTPIHSNAIEIQSLVADKYGIEEVYPFYNMNIVNYCINVRPDLKINGFSRYILREAIRDIVPEKIRNRTDKANLGHGLVQSFIDKDRELIKGHIKNPHPLIRELININELDSSWKNLLKNPRKYSTRSNVPSLIFSYVVANRWLELIYSQDNNLNKKT